MGAALLSEPEKVREVIKSIKCKFTNLVFRLCYSNESMI